MSAVEPQPRNGSRRPSRVALKSGRGATAAPNPGSGSDSLKVYCRIRPAAQPAPEITVDSDGRTISLDLSRANGSGGFIDNAVKNVSFRLERIFVNATQEAVYTATVAPLIDSFMDGINATAFCYGQTGAGKTYTMMGDTTLAFQSRGIIPRAISDVFARIEARPHILSTVRVSYLEIYQEQFYDLLCPPEDDTRPRTHAPRLPLKLKQQNIQVRTDASGDTQITGLAMPVCGSATEAYELLFRGDTSRVIAEHALNKHSSRSHTIFTIYLEQRTRDDKVDSVLSSKLHLVDLAGSERAGQMALNAGPLSSEAEQRAGMTLKEATHINKSLVFLGQVVLALARKQQHIPYRQSRLTSVLRDSLGGNARTIIISNISHESSNIFETLSTLRFATTAMKVQNDAHVNCTTDPESEIRRLKAEIQSLREELRLVRGESDSAGLLSPEEQQTVTAEVQSYLAGTLAVIPVRSAAQVTEAFSIMRDALLSVGYAPPAVAETTESTARLLTSAETDQVTKPRIVQRSQARLHSAVLPSLPSSGMVPLGAQPLTSDRPPRTRDAAFAEYILTEVGGMLWTAVQAERAGVQTHKEEVRASADDVNQIKTQIDEVKMRIRDYMETHREELEAAADNQEEEPEAPPELAQMLERLSELKIQYSLQYDKFASLKRELEQCRQHRSHAEAKLAAEFGIFFDENYSDVKGAAVTDPLPTETLRAQSATEQTETAFADALANTRMAKARGDLGQTSRLVAMKRHDINV